MFLAASPTKAASPATREILSSVWPGGQITLASRPRRGRESRPSPLTSRSFGRGSMGEAPVYPSFQPGIGVINISGPGRRNFPRRDEMSAGHQELGALLAHDDGKTGVFGRKHGQQAAVVAVVMGEEKTGEVSRG